MTHMTQLLGLGEETMTFQPFRYFWLGLVLCGVVLMIQPLNAAEAPAAPDRLTTADGDVMIHPVNHASLVLHWKDKVIAVDPVGGAARFAAFSKSALILLTDIHGDHLNLDTLGALATDKTVLVAPPAVVAQLTPALRQQTTVMTNGEIKTVLGLSLEALPMYNTTSSRQQFHPKGRGNGYVLTIGGKRIYLSGDTEDIPEMRALKNIDVALLCMNLPYTMDVEQAAQAVRAFRPKVVYPYHYRGSDLEKFKKLVGDDLGIEVRLRNWY
jgi:L-ascorbate metabolism protein UlaG (beta-lactamase superfamily)